MNSSGFREKPIVGSCYCNNKYSVLIYDGNFLTARLTVSFQEGCCPLKLVLVYIHKYLGAEQCFVLHDND